MLRVPQECFDDTGNLEHLIVPVPDTLRNLEDNLEQRNRISMEEFSNEQENMGMDSYKNIYHHNRGVPLMQNVQGTNQLLSYDSSAWDTNSNENQDLVYFGDLHEQVQHQLDQPFQQMQMQSYNSSSLPDSTDHPYPTPDLLNLLQLPRCSTSLMPNSSINIPNTTQKNSTSYQNSLGFLGELQSTGMDNTSGSSILYDPLFHLNLPPQPPIFRELFQSLPNGYSLPTSRNGSLFGGTTHEMDGKGGVFQDADGRQIENSVLQFSSGDMPCVGKRCKDGENTKHFATEKQRRQHLNGKFQYLRSLVPNPTKDDRASIVGDAISYIKELLRTVNYFQLLVENKRSGRDRSKRQKKEGGDEMEDCNVKPVCDSDPCYNGSLRSSWLQRKSKDTEVDVRIIDDEVTIKLIQRKKINCLLFASKMLDEFLLDLQHVAGGHIGDYCSFLFNTKINEGSSVYASAIASSMMEVMDRQYAAAISDPATNY